MALSNSKKKNECVLKLKNYTPESFQLWKDLEAQITNFASKHGHELVNIIYDDEKYTKSFTVLYDTVEKLNITPASIAQLMVEHKLEVEVVSSKDFPDSKMRTYLVLKLTNYTPESFQLWKDMEGEITENLATFGTILKDISYDEEKHTKSCTASYDSVEEFRKAIMSTTKKAILKGIIPELVSIKDAEDNITNLSMYKANKLIDKADISIKKLEAL